MGHYRSYKVRIRFLEKNTFSVQCLGLLIFLGLNLQLALKRTDTVSRTMFWPWRSHKIGCQRLLCDVFVRRCKWRSQGSQHIFQYFQEASWSHARFCSSCSRSSDRLLDCTTGTHRCGRRHRQLFWDLLLLVKHRPKMSIAKWSWPWEAPSLVKQRCVWHFGRLKDWAKWLANGWGLCQTLLEDETLWGLRAQFMEANCGYPLQTRKELCVHNVVKSVCKGHSSTSWVMGWASAKATPSI